MPCLLFSRCGITEVYDPATPGYTRKKMKQGGEKKTHNVSFQPEVKTFYRLQRRPSSLPSSSSPRSPLKLSNFLTVWSVYFKMTEVNLCLFPCGGFFPVTTITGAHFENEAVNKGPGPSSPVASSEGASPGVSAGAISVELFEKSGHCLLASSLSPSSFSFFLPPSVLHSLPRAVLTPLARRLRQCVQSL